MRRTFSPIREQKCPPAHQEASVTGRRKALRHGNPGFHDEATKRKPRQVVAPDEPHLGDDLTGKSPGEIAAAVRDLCVYRLARHGLDWAGIGELTTGRVKYKLSLAKGMGTRGAPLKPLATLVKWFDGVDLLGTGKRPSASEMACIYLLATIDSGDGVELQGDEYTAQHVVDRVTGTVERTLSRHGERAPDVLIDAPQARRIRSELGKGAVRQRTVGGEENLTNQPAKQTLWFRVPRATPRGHKQEK